MENNLFYKDLDIHEISLPELIGDEALFYNVPENWNIIVVDIEKSTQAIKNGLHHEVNLAATGSIIAVLNKIKETNKKTRIPYFFGGDGATFIVPPYLEEPLLELLENYRHHVRKNMYLSLKVGSMLVSDVYTSGETIKIAKFRVNPQLVIPIVLGTGLKNAERKIKSYFLDETVMPEDLVPVNLEGMECRWQEIEPPQEEDKIVCLVIDCQEEKLQSKVYQSILLEIKDIFGSYEERQPITTKKLKLDLAIQKIRKEMYARIGKNSFFYLLKNWLITIIGKYYFKFFKEGKAYLEKVSQLSYSLMIDGTFNCVISGTQEEINRLQVFLDKLEAQNMMKYGIHVTYASVMSCYVVDRKSKHIHFVDGTEGGFTSAAKMFKAKLLAI